MHAVWEGTFHFPKTIGLDIYIHCVLLGIRYCYKCSLSQNMINWDSLLFRKWTCGTVSMSVCMPHEQKVPVHYDGVAKNRMYQSW